GGGNRRHLRRSAPRWPRRRGDHLPAARLAAVAPALLGLPDPDRALQWLRRGAGTGRPAAGAAAADRLRAAPGGWAVAAGECVGLGLGAMPEVRRGRDA